MYVLGIFITARKRSCEGYVFTPVILFTGGVCPSVLWDTPPRTRGRHAPRAEADTPPSRTRGRHLPPQIRGRPPPGPEADTPSGADIPPRADPPPNLCSACWEIRPTSGRYASSWNAYLLSKYGYQIDCIKRLFICNQLGHNDLLLHVSEIIGVHLKLSLSSCLTAKFHLRSCSTSWYWRQHCCILCDFLLQSWHWQQHWRKSPHLLILISNAVAVISTSTLTILPSADSSVGWSACQRQTTCTVWKGTAPTTAWKSVPARRLADWGDACR